MYRKNTAGQFIHFQGVDATTGGIKSGVTWTQRRCIDGTFAAGGGTVTEDGTTGWYKCALAQADTNGNNIGYNFTGSGAVPQTVNFITDGSPPDVNLKNAAGTAVTLDANNVLNVSTKYVGGTLQTARDIGLSVLLASGQKVDVDTIKTNPVVNGGTVTFSTNSTVASTTNITAAAGCAVSSLGANVITAAATAADFGAEIATAIWTDTTASDFTTALSIGKSIMNGVALGTGLTINAYTGNTVQTGDSFARIGATGSGLTSLALASTALSTVQWTNTLATNLGTLASHDPGATLGTSTLTQTQVTGGAYALNSSSFAFNSAFDFTTTQKTSLNAATPAVTVSDKTGFALTSAYDLAKTAAQASDIPTANITAIKAKTDSLTFTVPGQVDANAESMNATTINGTGTSGDLWRGA